MKFLILISLLSTQLFGNFFTLTDSLEKLLIREKDLNKRTELLNEISTYYLYFNPNLGIIKAEEGLNLINFDINHKYYPSLLYNISLNYLKLNNFALSNIYQEKLKNYLQFKKSNDWKFKFDLLILEDYIAEKRFYQAKILSEKILLENKSLDKNKINEIELILAKLYIEVNLYDKAYQYLNKLMEFNLKTQNDIVLSKLYYYYAYLQLRVNSSNDSIISNLDESFNYAYNMNNLYLIKDIYSIYTTYYQLNGKYDKAFEHLKIQYIISDSIFNSKIINQNKLISMQNEISENNNNLKVANEKNYYQTVILIIIITFSVIFLILIFYILNKLKQTRLTNRQVVSANNQLNELINQLNEKNIEIESQNDNLNLIRKELETNNENKDKLISIISHDLRNPLTSINLLVEHLDSNTDKISKTDLKKFTGMLKNSSGTMTKLLEDLLNWATASTNAQFKLEKVNLFELINSEILVCIQMANSKNVSIINNINNDIFLNLDKNMISAVVRNLVTNAIKFTNPGGVVRIFAKSIMDTIYLEIEDTGQGMSEKVKSELFNPSKLKTTVGTAGEKGTGLGLLLVKEFLDKHNAGIEVDSKLGRGTKFIISFKKV